MSVALPRLDGRYRWGEVLARGASGSVHRGQDRLTGRTVALKRYEGTLDDGLVLHQKFWRWTKLSHPNLIKVLDYGCTVEGTPLLVMELAEGQDLGQVLERSEIAGPRARSLFADVALALAHLHEKGVVHGDIKPENCVLSPEGLKLVDWGGSELGTLAYLSPERLHGAEPSRRDDLYALGVLGMELVLGARASRFESVQAMRERLLACGDQAAELSEVLLALLDGAIANHADLLARLPGVVERLAGALGREVSLVGRDDALRELAAACQGRQTPPCGAWVVLGASGVGKSRLAQEALRARPGRVLRGFCKPVGQAPLQPWRDALDSLERRTPPGALMARWLAQGELGDKQQLFDEIARWLHAQPDLWVVIEDLQWADQVSLELFASLAARLAEWQDPGRIGGTTRPAVQIEPLLSLSRIRLVRLSPLALDDCTRLIAAHLDQAMVPSAFASWVFDVTAGNPMFVGELLRHLAAAGHLRSAAGAIHFPSAPPAASTGLQALVRAQADDLEPDARELLFWSTILGKRFSLEHLLDVTGWPQERLFWSVEELLTRRFWVQSGSWLDFRHDSLQEVLQGVWPAADLAAGHLKVARFLEREDASPIPLAYHFERAGTWSEAYRYHLRSGDLLAAQGSVGGALASWRRALELRDEIEGPLPDEAPPERVSQERFDLWDRLGMVAITIDPALGARVLGLARRRLLAEGDLRRHRGWLGLAMRWRADRLDWSLLARYTLSEPGRADRDKLLTALVRYHTYAAFQGLCHILRGEVSAAERCLAEGRAMLPWPGHWLAGLGKIPLCTYYGWHWQPSRVAPLADGALRHLKRAPRVLDPMLATVRIGAMFYRCVLPALSGTRRALGSLEAFLAAARAGNFLEHQTLAWSYQIALQGSTGGWADLQHAETEYERSLERCGMGITIFAEGLCHRLFAWFQQGDWHRVADLAAEEPEFFRGTFYHTWYKSLVAMALLASGRTEEGSRLVAELEQEDGSPYFGLTLARAWRALVTGDPEARTLLDRAVEQEGTEPHLHPIRHLWALRLRGEYAARAGDPREAARYYQAALAVSERMENRLQRAITLYWWGHSSLDADERERCFEEAEGLFRELGNPHYSPMIRRERVERWWIFSAGSVVQLPERLGIDSTLRTVVEWAMDTTKADRGKLLLVDEHGAITTRLSLSRSGASEVEAHSRTVAEHVLATGASLWLADVTRDERFRRGLSLQALDLRTVIGVPLRWEGRMRGLLYLDRREASEPFTREDFRLVETLAGYGALAMAHATVAERELQQRRNAEALLAMAKALRAEQPERLRRELVPLAREALGEAQVAIADDGLRIDWGEQAPSPEQRDLARGVAELAQLALERSEWQAREEEARMQAVLAGELAREREALVRQILHDLRNSVQAIGLMNAELACWAKDEPEAAFPVAEIDHQVGFLAAFLTQKLHRLMGKQDDQALTRLEEAFADLERKFRPICQARAQHLEVKACAPVSVAVAPVELAQILGNLLDNACKFTPPGGRIEVAGTEAQGWVKLSVRDSGPGVAATRGRPEASAGFGLGLSHARKLVGGAGGWLSHQDSESGTVFTVVLPTVEGGLAARESGGPA